MVRQNKNINGMKIADEEILISQFADDTTFFLDGTRRSFCTCMAVLKQFASMSGLCVNFEKTTAVWLGPYKNSRVRFMPELKLTWNPPFFKSLGVIFPTNISEIVPLNYENKLNEIRKLLSTWSKRNLTPFGKITVIKTLALSKLTHLFTNLPDPSEEFLVELNKLFFSFLWNGKNDRIKRSVMFQSYECGGFKMVDVKCFLSSLKITWLKRVLKSDGKITNILMKICPLFVKIKQRGSEFANVLMQRTSNPFWCDVFKHYKRFASKCIPLSFSDFASECVHYNGNICRDKKIIFIRNWIENGIVNIGSFCGSDGYLLFNEFKLKYPNANVNFLLYEGIVAAIKKYQDKIGVCMSEWSQLEDSCVWKAMFSGGANHIYSIFVKNNTPPKGIEKWSDVLNATIDTKTVFSHIMKTTTDTRLRWFQFRILHKILPTQKSLCLMKIVDSSQCTFCQNEEETLDHLFWECNKVQSFWSDFIGWLQTHFVHCTNLVLSRELIILGTKKNNYTDKIIDLFILSAKHHIFASKHQNTTPQLQIFIRTIKQRYLMEKCNAFNKGTYAKMTTQWIMYSHFFN